MEVDADRDRERDGLEGDIDLDEELDDERRRSRLRPRPRPCVFEGFDADGDRDREGGDSLDVVGDGGDTEQRPSDGPRLDDMVDADPEPDGTLRTIDREPDVFRIGFDVPGS